MIVSRAAVLLPLSLFIAACGGGGGRGGEGTADGGATDPDGGGGGTADASAPAVCGDGVKQLGEACDDDNDQPEDGCDSAAGSVELFAARLSVAPDSLRCLKKSAMRRSFMSS